MISMKMLKDIQLYMLYKLVMFDDQSFAIIENDDRISHIISTIFKSYSFRKIKYFYLFIHFNTLHVPGS